LLSLDDLLARCRLHLSAPAKTPETAGLIDKEALAKTKPASSSSTPLAAAW